MPDSSNRERGWEEICNILSKECPFYEPLDNQLEKKKKKKHLSCCKSQWLHLCSSLFHKLALKKGAVTPDASRQFDENKHSSFLPEVHLPKKVSRTDPSLFSLQSPFRGVSRSAHVYRGSLDSLREVLKCAPFTLYSDLRGEKEVAGCSW